MWVPRTRPPSSSDHPVLMDEAAQTIGSSQLGEVWLRVVLRSRFQCGWRSLAERAVGAVGVVMLDVLGKDCHEVVAPEDEHPVEAFAPDGAQHALADGVGPGLSSQSVASLWITSKEVTSPIAVRQSVVRGGGDALRAGARCWPQPQGCGGVGRF